MKILGFLSESFQDWDAGLASVIFTGGCSYACPACYAGKLVRNEEQHTTEEILKRLERKKAYVNKVVICGGEPTIHEDLPAFLGKIKEKGLLIKLDTNGTRPKMLQELLDNKLVDYAAMDIKGPKELYSNLTGRKDLDLKEEVEVGMKLLTKFPGYEFRTTIFPLYDSDKSSFRWMTPEEISEMSRWIVENTEKNDHLHYLQKFTARSKEEMIDPRFSKELLPKEYHETPDTLLLQMQEAARKYLPKSSIR